MLPLPCILNRLRPGLVPSCAEGGVLGILPGLVGVIQATETIKLILGSGEPLIGRLLLVDALAMRFRELKLRKNPECPACGTHPTVTELIDYNQFCGIRGEESPAQTTMTDMTVEELKQRLDRGDDLFVLDVREPHEYQICNLGGHLIPLNDLPKRVSELDSSREIVVHCKMGGRSAKAADFLRQSGFTKVHNLAGGINAWAERVDPKYPSTKARSLSFHLTPQLPGASRSIKLVTPPPPICKLSVFNRIATSPRKYLSAWELHVKSSAVRSCMASSRAAEGQPTSVARHTAACRLA